MLCCRKEQTSILINFYWIFHFPERQRASKSEREREMALRDFCDLTEKRQNVANIFTEF